jgi:DNA-nicking Smr family endonuclease
VARKSRRLSAEDRALWDRVAQSARPLRDGLTPKPAEARDTAPRPPPEPPITQPKDFAPHALRPALRPEGRLAAGVSWTALQDRPGPVRRGEPGLDRNTARRLAAGRRAPEARLDLHGMTWNRAHDALTRFIHDSAAQGRRCVLVVTGKGRGHGGEGEGVLKRDAPRWLGAPPLSALVVGVYEAHAKHGGGGALYVYLKKRRG